jgi:hypothetical protein
MKEKFTFLLNSNLRVQNKLLGKIGVGGTITEVLRVLKTPILPNITYVICHLSFASYVIYDRYMSYDTDDI